MNPTLTDGTADLNTTVDHLILGVAGLGHGVDWLETQTGVRAAIGGSHPGRGTHNALLSLGNRQYLEILAPDPAQEATAPRHDLADLLEPRLIAWAAAASDLAGLVRTDRAAGAHLSDPRDGARKTPDGRLVKWRTASVEETFSGNGVSPIPFFIEWAAGTVHPSEEYPAGCRLERFEILHPEPALLQRLLKQLGIDARVARGESVALVAALATPKGMIVLK